MVANNYCPYAFPIFPLAHRECLCGSYPGKFTGCNHKTYSFLDKYEITIHIRICIYIFGCVFFMVVHVFSLIIAVSLVLSHFSRQVPQQKPLPLGPCRGCAQGVAMEHWHLRDYGCLLPALPAQTLVELLTVLLRCHKRYLHTSACFCILTNCFKTCKRSHTGCLLENRTLFIGAWVFNFIIDFG